MAHVKKRGPGRWRARYRGPDGRERSQTFDRKVDAERWHAQVETDKARGRWVDPAAGRITFESWFEGVDGHDDRSSAEHAPTL